MPIILSSRLLILVSIFAVLLLTACAGPAAPATPTPAAAQTSEVFETSEVLTATAAATQTSEVFETSEVLTATPAATQTSEVFETSEVLTATPAATQTSEVFETSEVLTATPPVAWQDMPVIPTLSARARQVYQAGLARGNNPHGFAKAGDCETITDWFLVDFDRGPRFYGLGPYQDLQPVIDYFKGSFARSSLAARRGFNAAALLSAFWADSSQCKPAETPLGCEYRLTRPSFALIMLGTNDVPHKASFEHNLRQVIQFSLDQDVLPVLVTKADNLEGDASINATIAGLAQEYDLPLWNFWRAVQSLPDAGLQEDGAHLTFATNFFGDPEKMKSAWPWRNLTALQVLDAVLEGVK